MNLYAFTPGERSEPEKIFSAGRGREEERGTMRAGRTGQICGSVLRNLGFFPWREDSIPVIPAEAGIHGRLAVQPRPTWMPACAGMTECG
jgi:hypothetical protein